MKRLVIGDFKESFVSSDETVARVGSLSEGFDWSAKNGSPDEVFVSFGREDWERLQAVVTGLAPGSALAQEHDLGAGNFLKNLLVENANKLIPIYIDEIVAFEAEFKISRAYLKDGRKFSVGYSLRSLETLLQPGLFCRATRQWLVRITEIEYIDRLVIGKVKMNLRHDYDIPPIELSRESVPKILSLFGK